jgi:hypothetical protein
MLAAGLAAGCGPRIAVVQVAIVKPRPADCSIEWPEIDQATASWQYKLVGQLLLRGGGADELTPELKEELSQKACEMGGEIVVLSAMVQGSFRNAAQSGFSVWKKP